ncbi:hypothetical protein GC105_12135 [Alkalibaculum sp. M08DMB]|uniref:Sigma-54 factor interaction domain-containing protein n=1 Tax=Alkalibaculum sporogenes TaxID=2655001 RepID=A0A6A7KAJ7_9FIRM|nr:sigma 54-interacting transcriptional regulator [Alkalibaculum sporogenes]MPW26538.1 hypothetical protein [Alkalibaculum sporogenes]
MINDDELDLEQLHNFISIGIIKLNWKLEIININQTATDAMFIKKYDSIGRVITDFLILDDESIKKLIKKETFDYTLSYRNTGVDVLKFFISGYHLDYGNKIEYVLLIYSYNKVKESLNKQTLLKNGTFDEVYGISNIIRTLKEKSVYVSKYDCPLLIKGERGTKKYSFSRAIHNMSDRKEKQFITIDCTKFSKRIIENELFGYGSQQVGTLTKKKGLLNIAVNATFYIHEVGYLSICVQTKLLDYITKNILLNNAEEKHGNRFIFSTSEALNEKVKNGLILEEFYSAISFITLDIPPLREHKEDIPIIVDGLIKKNNILMKKNIKGATIDFYNEIIKYSWPQNIDELENLIENAMNCCINDFLDYEDLYFVSKVNNKWDKVSGHLRYIENSKKKPKLLKELMGLEERKVLMSMTSYWSDKKKVAKLLGISYANLQKKLKKYQLM